MVKYLPAAAALFLAVVFAFGATSKPRNLACDRSTCTYGDRTFPFADVREVRFVDGFGKNKTQAESQLILASGHQINVGRDDTDDARTTFQLLREFFAPGGPPTLTMTAKGMTWMWFLVVACVVAAGVLGVQGHRKRDTYRPPGVRWQWPNKKILVGIGVVVALGLTQATIMFIAGKVQGTLILQCEQRCRFQGIECLPGGSSRQTLDAGTYQIDLWAAQGSALWIPQTFTITKGETTTFVCRDPRTP